VYSYAENSQGWGYLVRTTDRQTDACEDSVQIALGVGVSAAAFERGCKRRAKQPQTCGGFTLLDVLISISVIGVLISLMLPTLSKVRETTHKVICSGHIRELLLASEHYARDYKSMLPGSVYAPKVLDASFQPQRMQTVRLEGVTPGWDGLGVLWFGNYGVSVSSYYCPAHTGEHRMTRHLAAFMIDGTTEIVSNYHLRALPQGTNMIDRYGPSTAFVTDGLSSQTDFSHKFGSNVGRLDWSVNWYSDPSGRFAKELPSSITDIQARQRVEDAWNLLDLPGGGLNSGGR